MMVGGRKEQPLEFFQLSKYCPETFCANVPVQECQDADGDDALFLFLFGSIEERDLFAWDAKAAYKQTHVWRQSR